MKESKYPRLSLRLSPELAAACKAAGPDRIREALAVLLSDKPLSDKPALSDKPKAAQPIVRQTEPDLVGQLSDKAPLSDKEAPAVVGQSTGAKPVPKWAAQVDKLAEAKRARDRERAAKEQAGRTV